MNLVQRFGLVFCSSLLVPVLNIAAQGYPTHTFVPAISSVSSNLFSKDIHDQQSGGTLSVTPYSESKTPTSPLRNCGSIRASASL